MPPPRVLVVVSCALAFPLAPIDAAASVTGHKENGPRRNSRRGRFVPMQHALPCRSVGHIVGLEAGKPVDHALFVAPQDPPAGLRAVASRLRHAALVTAVLVGIAAPVAATTLTGDVVMADAESTTTTSAKAAEAAKAAADAPAAPAEPTTGPGYRILSTDGGVFTHGWVSFEGSAAGETVSPTVGIAHDDDGDGYWVASADGGVFAFGDAPFQGSAAGASAKPIADIAATPSGAGYWLVASDGGIFAFGDAAFFGSRSPISASPPASCRWPRRPRATATGSSAPTAVCSPSATLRSSARSVISS